APPAAGSAVGGGGTSTAAAGAGVGALGSPPAPSRSSSSVSGTGSGPAWARPPAGSAPGPQPVPPSNRKAATPASAAAMRAGRVRRRAAPHAARGGRASVLLVLRDAVDGIFH